jgi:hypothetical protein
LITRLDANPAGKINFFANEELARSDKYSSRAEVSSVLIKREPQLLATGVLH